MQWEMESPSHDPVEDPSWRESYYFEFFDESTGIGVFHSLGERPHKGYSGVFMGIWGNQNFSLLDWDRLRRSDDGTIHQSSGLTYEFSSASRSWRMQFDGEMLVSPPIGGPGGDRRVPFELMTPFSEMDQSTTRVAHKHVSFDIEFFPTGEAYHYDHEAEIWERVFDEHVDQFGRYEGVLSIDETSYPLSGRGMRDHSWGMRSWTSVDQWTFGWLPLGPDSQMSFWRLEAEGEVAVDGIADHNGADDIRQIGEIETDIKYAEDDNPEAEVTAVDILVGYGQESSAASERISLEIERIVPVRFVNPQSGRQTIIDHCLARFVGLDGEARHGMFELTRTFGFDER